MMKITDAKRFENITIAKPSSEFGERILLVLGQQRRTKTWLAERVGISKQAINYLLYHSSTPKYVNEIASVLEINPEWLMFGKNTQQLFSEQKSEIVFVPVLSFNEISNYFKHKNKITATEFTHLTVNNNVSENCFATILENKSMEPLFNQDTLLIFNPDIKAKSGDYIIFILNDDILFRQYFIDGKETYLKAINTMFKTYNGKNIKILGTLIESRNQFK